MIGRVSARVGNQCWGDLTYMAFFSVSPLGPGMVGKNERCMRCIKLNNF